MGIDGPILELYAKTSKIDYITDAVHNLDFNGTKIPFWKEIVRKILEVKI